MFTEDNDVSYEKYIEMKRKYLKLKNQLGGESVQAILDRYNGGAKAEEVTKTQVADQAVAALTARTAKSPVAEEQAKVPTNEPTDITGANKAAEVEEKAESSSQQQASSSSQQQAAQADAAEVEEKAAESSSQQQQQEAAESPSQQQAASSQQQQQGVAAAQKEETVVINNSSTVPIGPGNIEISSSNASPSSPATVSNNNRTKSRIPKWISKFFGDKNSEQKGGYNSDSDIDTINWNDSDSDSNYDSDTDTLNW